MKRTRLLFCAPALSSALVALGFVNSCGKDSNPVDPDSLPPFVQWVLPDVTAAGDTVFVFDEDTTTIQINAGDDGGVISSVKIYLNGAVALTLTTAPYRTVLSLAGISNNRSARVWATASDPTGKVGSTADTLRFIRNVPPDTARWSQLFPSRNPSARDGFTWEVDPQGARGLLFGGYAFATFSSTQDLWSFDLSTSQWDSLAPAGTPPVSRTRHGGGLSGSTMIVFGGEQIEGVVDSVLEEYSLLDLGTLTWNSGLFDLTLRPVMAMSSATLGTAVVVYGGAGTPADSAHDSLLRYSFLGDNWESLQPANGLPGDRALALVAANSEDDEFFLYGGTAGQLSDGPAGTSNFRLDLGNLTWVSTAAPGPPGLVDGAAVYDSSQHRILVWGGRNSGGALPVEVWEFSLGAHTWRQVPTLGTPPSGRTGHRLIYDAAHNRVVMFGGRLSGSWSSETWELAW